jgi:formate dehydrogenase maturation protein FdhE
MFDDILGKRIEKDFDLEKYKAMPYCYSCGSKDIIKVKDQLTSENVVNHMRCSFCGKTWKEYVNANADLERLE